MNSSDQADVKKKTTRKRYDIPKTASCHVCGDQAAEHLHYGGIACYSCRAFFRRTVNSNRPILECSNDQDCKINKDTRKRCQWCRFEKCKTVGMKTSWVLTEDDKNKLATRKNAPSPVATTSTNAVTIKKEDPHESLIPLQSMPSSENGITVKQRHASSPLSQIGDSSPIAASPQYKNDLNPVCWPGVPNSSSPDTGNIFFQNGINPHTGRPFISSFGINDTAHGSKSHMNERNIYGGESQQQDLKPFHNVSPRKSLEEKHERQQNLFPLNINKMHVSLSGATEGVSLTIETHQGISNMGQSSSARSFPYQGADKGSMIGLSQGHWTSQDRDTHDNESNTSALSPNSSRLEHQSKRQKRHHQQSRTIFRCVSSENAERNCDSRSTIASPHSDSSGSHQNLQDFTDHVYAPDNALHVNTDNVMLDSVRQDMFGGSGHLDNPDHRSRPQVWKLGEVSSSLPPSPMPQQLNTFTLQETIFVQQLIAIDERVRFQVPMEVVQVRTFLDCAVSGSHISQMAIMHAYQTCIKRIVRFANSLQDFVELPPDDMQKLLVSNTVSIINIKISRWLSEDTSLFAQMGLLGTGQDLFKDALQEGKLSEGTPLKVGYDDVFSSPWCCDSSHEDRYEALIAQIHQLDP